MATKLSAEEKAARKEARIEARQLAKWRAEIDAQKAQRPVARIDITLTWRKSTYGWCPRGKARVIYADGGYECRDHYFAGGCGYDKKSTILAEVFRDFLAYRLHDPELFTPDYQERMTAERVLGWAENGPVMPYGASFYNGKAYYDGGIGDSCYTRSIAPFIGGTLEHVAEDNTFDVYRFTMNTQPTDGNIQKGVSNAPRN